MTHSKTPSRALLLAASVVMIAACGPLTGEFWDREADQPRLASATNRLPLAYGDGSAQCPSHVEVDDEVIPLEDYVAGVVFAEFFFLGMTEDEHAIRRVGGSRPLAAVLQSLTSEWPKLRSLARSEEAVDLGAANYCMTYASWVVAFAAAIVARSYVCQHWLRTGHRSIPNSEETQEYDRRGWKGAANNCRLTAERCLRLDRKATIAQLAATETQNKVVEFCACSPKDPEQPYCIVANTEYSKAHGKEYHGMRPVHGDETAVARAQDCRIEFGDPAVNPLGQHELGQKKLGHGRGLSQMALYAWARHEAVSVEEQFSRSYYTNGMCRVMALADARRQIGDVYPGTTIVKAEKRATSPNKVAGVLQTLAGLLQEDQNLRVAQRESD